MHIAPNRFVGAAMFSSGELNTMPNEYGRHPSLLSSLTGAVETEKFTCFLRGTAPAQPLGEEGAGKRAQLEKGVSGSRLISLLR